MTLPLILQGSGPLFMAWCPLKNKIRVSFFLIFQFEQLIIPRPSTLVRISKSTRIHRYGCSLTNKLLDEFISLFWTMYFLVIFHADIHFVTFYCIFLVRFHFLRFRFPIPHNFFGVYGRLWAFMGFLTQKLNTVSM